ncbi:MAG: hypothetical protein BGP03_06465 [Pseudonocardia sp. 73-21]|nr:MAG: hypothetical protein BGP03_06465 [Pseudonocardia sp. 73-21]
MTAAGGRTLGLRECGQQVRGGAAQPVPGRLQHDDGTEQLGSPGRERQREVAPGAPSEHIGGPAEVFQDRGEIVDVDAVVPHGAVHRPAVPTPVVGQHAPAAGGEVGRRTPPRRGLRPGAVHEHERVALAVPVERQLGAVDRYPHHH